MVGEKECRRSIGDSYEIMEQDLRLCIEMCLDEDRIGCGAICNKYLNDNWEIVNCRYVEKR